MPSQASVFYRPCPNCGSSSYRLKDQHTPAPKIECSDCLAERGDWRDFVKAAKKAHRSEPVTGRIAWPRTRSETVEIWSRLPRTHPRRKAAKPRDILDGSAQADARAEIECEFP